MGLPKGFRYSGVACGIKKSGKPDLALITVDQPAVVAGVYTQNVVRATSIDWNQAITPGDSFRGLVINSGNANACTGQQGIDDNQKMANQVAKGLEANPTQVCVLSTGIIGHVLPMNRVESGIRDAVQALTATQAGFEAAARGILTTDKGPKTLQTSVSIDNQEIRIAGMAKGAGMIGPNMATMLAVMMTDVRMSAANAQAALTHAANHSFNRITVEGHTSTNDALMLICSGKSGVRLEKAQDLQEFRSALTTACVELAKQIPSDGEGATHLVTITVTGANNEADADRVARTIALSALVKTAITGSDPNWGRIVSAAGYAGVQMEVAATDLQINGHFVFQSGRPCQFEAAVVSQSMSSQFEILIDLKIGNGPGRATHWTSDLTVDYVRFNSEYTT